MLPVIVFILQDFLRDFWPQVQAAHELYTSISQALQEKESEASQKEYSEHLPAEVLEAGIKSGRYIKVQVQGLSKDCLQQPVDFRETQMVTGELN